MTIAQQLNIKTFPFSIKDEKGNEIYCENSDGEGNLYWVKKEYDENGNQICCIIGEDSNGCIGENRPPKVVEIEGIKYKLVKL